jgi:hypothetical protein
MRKLITRKNAVLFFGVIFFLTVILKIGSMSGYCWKNNLSCSEAYWIFFPVSISIIPAILLIFLESRLFNSWIKFVFSWLIFSWWFIWIHRFGGLLSPGPDGASTLTSFVLFSMSFFLILIKSWEFKALDRGVPVNIWLERFLFVIAFVISILLSIVLYGFIM